ncbi:flagellar hook-length control protein FliK [Sphingomonas yunnanensis]|uniref:flagellar hook-length control protein FliK n=1 Tax=Sphingomonas yunnanensis TaxID=310400 RepID=UPI001CA6C0F8|nr:flagellar hook-length control protein FliK [Sphingomonas yunnanensis]MBY9064243.1 flagellar hook-length control protein FliK [Sphingomonas yunnanensis]
MTTIASLLLTAAPGALATPGAPAGESLAAGAGGRTRLAVAGGTFLDLVAPASDGTPAAAAGGRQALAVPGSDLPVALGEGAPLAAGPTGEAALAWLADATGLDVPPASSVPETVVAAAATPRHAVPLPAGAVLGRAAAVRRAIAPEPPASTSEAVVADVALLRSNRASTLDETATAESAGGERPAAAPSEPLATTPVAPAILATPTMTPPFLAAPVRRDAAANNEAAVPPTVGSVAAPGQTAVTHDSAPTLPLAPRDTIPAKGFPASARPADITLAPAAPTPAASAATASPVATSVGDVPPARADAPTAATPLPDIAGKRAAVPTLTPGPAIASSPARAAASASSTPAATMPATVIATEGTEAATPSGNPTATVAAATDALSVPPRTTARRAAAPAGPSRVDSAARPALLPATGAGQIAAAVAAPAKPPLATVPPPIPSGTEQVRVQVAPRRGAVDETAPAPAAIPADAAPPRQGARAPLPTLDADAARPVVASATPPRSPAAVAPVAAASTPTPVASVASVAPVIAAAAPARVDAPLTLAPPASPATAPVATLPTADGSAAAIAATALPADPAATGPVDSAAAVALDPAPHAASTAVAATPVALPAAAAPAIATAARTFADAIHRAVTADERAAPAEPLPTAQLAQPATGAITAAAVAAPQPATQQPLDMTHGRWPEAMIHRIEMLRDMANANDVRIRLVPDALGAIDVSLRRDGDTVQVQLVAEQPQTRALLAEAQPRLQEMAEQRGIKLQHGGSATAGNGSGGNGSASTPQQGQASSGGSQAAQTAAGQSQGSNAGQQPDRQQPQAQQQRAPRTPASVRRVADAAPTDDRIA